MSAPISPTMTEFGQKLQAWESAVAGWLGLDLADVWDLSTKPVPYGRLRGVVRVKWKSTTMHIPPVGYFEHWDIEVSDDRICTGHLLLLPEDAERMEVAVGPKPELMSAEDAAKLRAMMIGQGLSCPNCGHITAPA